MIYNVTHTDRNIEKEINDVVGSPYTLLERLRLKGVGSERFIIREMSACFDEYKIDRTDENYCNIELRPNGIIVHFSKVLQRFVWVIPFYQLTIYQSGSLLSIYRNTHFIKMQPQGLKSSISKFSRKVLSAKVEALG